MRTGSILTLCLLVLAITAGCTEPPNNKLEAKKNLVRQFTEATNAANWQALSDLVADDFARHSAASVGPPVTSREEFIELQKGFLHTFPDQRIQIDRLVAEGELVAVMATYSGTQSGPMGDLPATGKQFQSPFLAIFRIESGKIVELWVEWDNIAILSQLGLFPPPSPSQP